MTAARSLISPLSFFRELGLTYYDEKWGVPAHDDRKQFEFLMLEAMQCGLQLGHGAAKAGDIPRLF